MMAMENNRREPETAACSTPRRRRRRNRATTTTAAAAMSLLALSNSLMTSSQAAAFTLPLTAVRLPNNSYTQLSQSAAMEMPDRGDHSNNMPIRTNQSLIRLTLNEELALLRHMRAHPAHTSMHQMARETLMLHNLPLVQSIVTKILKSRPQLQQNLRGGRAGNGKVWQQPESQVGAALTKDDLLHEGTIGLAEAIDRYDLAYAYADEDEEASSRDASESSSPFLPKGARLGTYATYWIRARIVRAIQSREHAVFRFPEHVLQASHRLVKASRELGLEWDVVSELADFDVITVAQEKLRDQIRIAAGIKSDSLFREAVRVRGMSQSSSTTLESWMSPSADSAEATSEESELFSEAGQDHVLDTLSKFLMPREVEVLSLRYGLVSAEEEETEEASQSQQILFRNYQAEAEEELFGQDGILSHYSDEKAPAAAATSQKANGTSQAAAASMPSTTRKSQKKATALKARTLLPFKEVGKRMKFSGEYCRRTCTQALNKLACAVEEGRLAESDFSLGW